MMCCKCGSHMSCCVNLSVKDCLGWRYLRAMSTTECRFRPQLCTVLGIYRVT
jgi:hypothetical protein